MNRSTRGVAGVVNQQYVGNHKNVCACASQHKRRVTTAATITTSRQRTISEQRTQTVQGSERVDVESSTLPRAAWCVEKGAKAGVRKSE